MATAAQIRAEIEAVLARKIPSALTPAPRIIRPTSNSGIEALDSLLGGGLPTGAITEVVGPECSGRTSLALSFLCQLTRHGKVCAWVDVSDMLHPESAAAAGVDLDRLLWVRCGSEETDSRPTSAAFKNKVQPPQTSRVQLGGNSPHPRSESKGLPSAIGDFLGNRDKTIGTPGVSNRPLKCDAPTAMLQDKEQVSPDRQQARRGTFVLEQREAYGPRCAEPQRKVRNETKSYERIKVSGSSRLDYNKPAEKPWLRLDQALRVTDLLLQAGGFSAIVLDMGSISPEHVSRIPLATWFRYRAAAQQTQSSFVILSQHLCAKSSADVVLRLDTASPHSMGHSVFSGSVTHAELIRRRYEQEPENVVSIRKPPQRANTVDWRTGTAWATPRKAE